MWVWAYGFYMFNLSLTYEVQKTKKIQRSNALIGLMKQPHNFVILTAQTLFQKFSLLKHVQQ